MLTDVVIANKTYAKLIVPVEAVMDEIAIKVIKQDIPDFLLPIKMIHIDENTELRYEIGEGTRLSYLPDNMSKRDFVTLLENMIRPFQTCNDWFLDYHSFCLDCNYIIVGKNYTSVRYIYIPDNKHVQSEEDILNFFRDFILNINLSDEPAYVMKLYRHLKEKNASLVSMLDYLSHETAGAYTATESEAPRQEEKKKSFIEAGREIINNIGREESTSRISKPEPEPTPAAEPEVEKPVKGFGESDVKNDLINNLFGDAPEEDNKKKSKAAKAEKPPKEKSSKGILGGLFGGSKGNADKDNNVKTGNNKGSQEPAQSNFVVRETPQTVQNTAPIESNPYYDSEDVTIIGSSQVAVSDGTKLTLQLEEDRGYQFPKYIEIDLSKGHTTVGRYDKAGNPQADYNFDASLSFVSKRHFRIERIGEQYRIIDVGSSNGTILNNETLVPNMPYTLNVGDRIIMSKVHRITYKVC